MRGLRELQQLIHKNGETADDIYHLVPHPEQDMTESGPLQGFTPDVTDGAYLYSRIATLPRCVHELLLGNEDVLTFRIGSEPYRVLPFGVNELDKAFDTFKPFYSCVWSVNDEIERVVDAYLRTRSLPVLHIAPSGTNGAIRPHQITRGTIRAYVARVLEHQERMGQGDELSRELRVALLEADPFRKVPIELPRYEHLVLRPNVDALKAIGFSFVESKVASIDALDNQPFFEAMEQLVGLISNIRTEVQNVRPFVSPTSPYDLILTAPSVLKHLRTMLSTFGRDLSAEKRRRIRLILRQIIGRETYLLTAEEAQMLDAVADEHVQAMLAINKQDLDAYTAALIIRASSNFVPVIRLPTAVNNVRGDLIQLENTARAETRSLRRANKLSKLAKRLSTKLKEGLPEWMIDQVKASSGVKLITDAPLEWMDVGGVPMALSTDVSRIPTTPGNLFFHLTVAPILIRLTQAAFDEVLVVRAFKKTDPIRNILTVSLEIMKKAFKDGKPRIKYADVENERDFIRAFDSFTGALAVFDGHGKHSSEDDMGSLVLPDGYLSGWELRGRVRIPPIIVLSACDTHPMSASHNTTANGFLAAGARTVLGTSLPVDARSSAEFVCRLLLRISSFIPEFFKHRDTPINWSRLVSGMQKRIYMTKVVYAIADKLKIEPSVELLGEISTEAGVMIDYDMKGWLDRLVAILANRASLSETDVRSLMENEAYLTDALIYLQLGNPEHISIFKT